MSTQSSSNATPSGGVVISLTSRPSTSESASSMSASSLRRVDPSGNVMTTGGAASPATGSPANAAENSSSFAQRLGTLALATMPVSTSRTA